MLTRLVPFFLFLLPFQFAITLGVGIDLPFGRILALGLVLWWLGGALASRTLYLPSLFVTGSVFSFLLVASASFLWAADESLALRKIAFLLNFFPLFFVFYDLRRSETISLRWEKALVLGGGVIAAGSLILFSAQFIFGLEPVLSWLRSILPFILGQNLGKNVLEYPSLLVNIGGETWLRATGFFPDPHVASFYFGIVWFIAVALFLQTKKYFWLFISGVLFIADLLTFSRGGYLGLLVGGATFLILGWENFTNNLKRGIGWSLFVIFLLGSILGQSVFSRFYSSFTLADASSTDRIALWQEAGRHILERPLLGTGLGNYIVEARPILDPRAPFYAHNLYLDITVELGLLGLLFFLIPIGIGYSYGLKSVRMMSRNSYIRLGVISALTLYLTHSLFETALFSVHILPIYLLMISAAVRLEHHAGVIKESKNLPSLKS